MKVTIILLSLISVETVRFSRFSPFLSLSRPNSFLTDRESNECRRVPLGDAITAQKESKKGREGTPSTRRSVASGIVVHSSIRPDKIHFLLLIFWPPKWIKLSLAVVVSLENFRLALSLRTAVADHPNHDIVSLIIPIQSCRFLSKRLRETRAGGWRQKDADSRNLFQRRTSRRTDERCPRQTG